jgi:hypothetical protein
MDVRHVSRRIKSATNYRKFASAGEELSVRIDRLALDRIADAVLVAEQFGRSAAGLLAGRVTSAESGSGARHRITVDAFLPITGEWSGGFFDYNTAVRERIEAHLRTMAVEHALVGFMRSSLSEGGLTASDRALMATNFGDAGVFLLVENPGNLCGTLYTPGAGGFASARPAYTFLFASPRERPEPRTLSGPARAEGRTAQAVGSAWKSAAIAAASTTVVLAIAFLAYQAGGIDLSRLRPAYRDDGSSQLPVELNAQRTAGGNEWRVSWNRASTAIRNADKARLVIQDGPLNKEVQLTDADLRTGSIIFSPLTDNVNLKLELFDTAHGRDFSEAIRVLGPTYASPSRAFEQAVDSVLRGLSVGLSSGESGRNVVRQIEQSALPDSKRELPEESQPRARRPFLPSDSGRITVSRTATDLPEPPDVQIAGVSQASPASRGSFNPLQWPLPIGPQAASNSAAPGPPLNKKPNVAVQSEAAPGLEPASPASRSSRLEPAQLVTRVEPVYPKLPFPRAPVSVHIEATIGEDGRLHDAKALSGPVLFRKSALAAIDRWLYRPAKLSGRNISTPTIIDVHFH